MNDADLLQRLCEVSEAIKQLKARYFRLMDQKKWDEWAMVFAEDAHLVVPEGGVDERGRAAVVASVSGVWEGVRTAHHGHMPEIRDHRCRHRARHLGDVRLRRVSAGSEW